MFRRRYESGYVGITGRASKRRMLNNYWRGSRGGPLRRMATYNFPPRRPTANAKASYALRAIRKLKKEQEKKIISSSAGTMQIPIGGNWIINGFGPYVTQGNDYDDRIGRKITIVNLSMRFNIRLSAIEALGTNVRLIICYDRKPAGADATAANIMATANNILDPYNWGQDYRGRFQILYDKTIPFTISQGQKAGKAFFKGPMNIKYNEGNAGNVTDLVKGNFLILAGAKGNAAAIDVDYAFTYRYTDD